jgi:hypothetical protein
MGSAFKRVFESNLCSESRPGFVQNPQRHGADHPRHENSLALGVRLHPQA